MSPKSESQIWVQSPKSEFLTEAITVIIGKGGIQGGLKGGLKGGLQEGPKEVVQESFILLHYSRQESLFPMIWDFYWTLS